MIRNSINQFVYPNPPAGGSELIISAPFRDGVIRENQFADYKDNSKMICVF